LFYFDKLIIHIYSILKYFLQIYIYIYIYIYRPLVSIRTWWKKWDHILWTHWEELWSSSWPIRSRRRSGGILTYRKIWIRVWRRGRSPRPATDRGGFFQSHRLDS